ncbi:MAG: GNAT family N-acetyltransferase [Gaiellaceae bacterium]
MESEALAVHRALVSTTARLYAEIEGARFEPRSDLIVAVCPGLSAPPFNGPWVVEDSPDAVAALPAAVAEVEAAGERAWVLTRSAHTRTRAAVRRLGLTHEERLPALVAHPEELAETAGSALEIAPIARHEIDETLDVLVVAFDEPRELFACVTSAARRLSGTRWYVGRSGGRVVSTALGMTGDAAVGIFNVATLPEHRGHGYGAALTARAAADGFAGGAELAYLQSSSIGHSVYRRLGFRDVEEYVLLTRPQPA